MFSKIIVLKFVKHFFLNLLLHLTPSLPWDWCRSCCVYIADKKVIELINQKLKVVMVLSPSLLVQMMWVNQTKSSMAKHDGFWPKRKLVYINKCIYLLSVNTAQKQKYFFNIWQVFLFWHIYNLSIFFTSCKNFLHSFPFFPFQWFSVFSYNSDILKLLFIHKFKFFCSITIPLYTVWPILILSLFSALLP